MSNIPCMLTLEGDTKHTSKTLSATTDLLV